MIRTPELVESQVKALVSTLRDRGFSVTHQRLEVYRALVADDTHPDAEGIHERVRKSIPSISLGTVYKAIDTLKNLGVIAEVDAPRSATRYEAVLEPHQHLVCEECERIVDFSEPGFGIVRPPARLANGFEVRACQVSFIGTCRECQARARTGALRPKSRALPRPRSDAGTSA